MVPYRRYPKIKPGKNMNTVFPIIKYMIEKINDEMMRLGTGGMNNLSLSLGK